uniref:Uncharacterized protein n=1 Tax=Parastrongyloides trichosuri TaxID=131310 RepID=A0A0N4ZVN8_PARTI
MGGAADRALLRLRLRPLPGLSPRAPAARGPAGCGGGGRDGVQRRPVELGRDHRPVGRPADPGSGQHSSGQGRRSELGARCLSRRDQLRRLYAVRPVADTGGQCRRPSDGR